MRLEYNPEIGFFDVNFTRVDMTLSTTIHKP